MLISTCVGLHTCAPQAAASAHFQENIARSTNGIYNKKCHFFIVIYTTICTCVMNYTHMCTTSQVCILWEILYNFLVPESYIQKCTFSYHNCYSHIKKNICAVFHVRRKFPMKTYVLEAFSLLISRMTHHYKMMLELISLLTVGTGGAVRV